YLQVLVIGWNRRVLALLEEMAGTRGVRFQVTSFADVAEPHRRAQVPKGLLGALDVRFRTGQPTSRDDLADVLGQVRPDAISLHSTPQWETGGHESALTAADSATVITMILLGEFMQKSDYNVVVDLFIPENAERIGDHLPFGIVPWSRLL